MEPLFFRNGTAFTGTANIDPKGQATIVKPHICGRCGGAGGSDAWKFTGWTCFQCGGRGETGLDTIKLFTAEKLAKLNATAAVKAEKKAAKAAAAKAVADAETEARRAEFTAKHGALLGRAAAVADRNEFVKDVLAKAVAKAEMTEKQEAALAAAVARIEASDAEKATAAPLPEAGRFRIEGEVLTTKVVESQFGLTTKMLVKADAGWKVWGTVPTAALETVHGITRGDRVAFTATVEASKDDPLFGWFKRPAKFEMIKEAAQ